MEQNKNNLEQLLQKVSSHGEELSTQNNLRAEDNILQGSKFGKFKTAEALLNAYNNLQADYTKKCQALSVLQKEEKENVLQPTSVQQTSVKENLQINKDIEKTFNNEEENNKLTINKDVSEKFEVEKSLLKPQEQNLSKNTLNVKEDKNIIQNDIQNKEVYEQNNNLNNSQKNTLTSQNFNLQNELKSFFELNPNAEKYETELIKMIVEDNVLKTSKNPLNEVWNKFVSTKFLDEKELANNNEFLQKYIFSNEDITNKIISNYFNSLNFNNSPTLISSQKGSESVLAPVNKPKTIKEARKIVEEMFS